MKEAQTWLDEKYPLNQREQVEEVNNNYGEELTGRLVIKNFPNLKRVWLARNKSITKLLVRNCPRTEKIDVSNNQITKLVVDGLTNLESLNCSNNQLAGLDISQNKKMKSLLCAGNPQLRRENFKGIEGLTQLSVINCDDNLKPVQILQSQLQQNQQQLNRIQRDLETKNRQLAEISDTIINAQNELGVTNLNTLPLIPQGENLNSLLQRPAREELEQVKNELDIERDHARDMDNWYRRLIDERLGNELLQSLHENQSRSKLADELRIENEITKQIAETEIKDNLRLFNKVQDKKKELKEIKTDAKVKLENDAQKIFLKNLLTAQEQLVLLKDADQQTRWPSERQLQRAKQNLSSKLGEEEISSLCQLQVEIVNLEMELEQIKKDRLEARIEVNQPPRFEN